MRVTDIMSAKVHTVDVNDYVSRALGLMEKHRISQVVVAGGGEYKGMLELKKIVLRDIDPEQTKASTLMTASPVLGADQDISGAIEILLNAGFRALPVMDGGGVAGMLSETDIIAKSGALKNDRRTLGDLAVSCVYAAPHDKVSTIRRIMADTNVSRVPVVDENRLIGVVGTHDLIAVVRGRGAPDDRGGTGTERAVTEKVRTMGVRADAIMKEPVIVQKDMHLAKALPLFAEHEELFLFDDGVSVVTPRDVLELLRPQPTKGVHVQITGLHNEPATVAAALDRATTIFIETLGRSIERVESLFVHVESHTKGGKKKYSVRARLRTPLGLFVAHKWGWQPTTVVQETFEALEREIRTKHGKVATQRRGRR